MNVCILGLGSNIAPEKNIPEAIAILREGHKVVEVSKMLRSSPIGIKNQPDFINGAIKVKTNLFKEEFVMYLKSVEDRLGRDRGAPKFGPRTIDIDIVVWNGMIVDKDYYTRSFLKKLVDSLM